ncbi:pseudouridine synthase [Myxococcus sp. RHSTA-1-4]|uniref:pseudouridine synthase n=1 Tax=Myxococcus sp. RHSTA-1-4 TaxID=2874601 RepID=UPI001CBAF1D7|nr:pseudouridine synthase [Myxococcus sp. RHSTA-1-4]MBZ4417327.1 pseudouridine synthase [Myxococcus sp. RHSTA-1-4]
MAAERLQKYLARAGVASRRHAEELITAGRVTVNNETVTELGSRVEPGKDLVAVDGQLVSPPEESSYFVLYKPIGVVTTLSDPQGRPTVANYVEETGKRLFPVGRLDYDAEGALLFTDDGALAHKLTHPSFQVPRMYLAKVKGVPDAATLDKLRGGVRLEDGMATPLSVDVFEAAEKNTWLKIVVAEGRPHLIKRLCAAVGHPVVRLFRPAYAGVGVEGMRPGDLRSLKKAEVELLNAVAEGRSQPPAVELKLPPRRHGRAAPGFDGEEAELSMDDEAPEVPESTGRRAARAMDARPEKRERKPAAEGGGTGMARFGRARGAEAGRPQRREWGAGGDEAPRGRGAGRPERKAWGEGGAPRGRGAAGRPERKEWSAGGAGRPERKAWGAGGDEGGAPRGRGAGRPERKEWSAGRDEGAPRGGGAGRPERGGEERPRARGFGAGRAERGGEERPRARGFGAGGAGRPERGGEERPRARGFGAGGAGRPERREWSAGGGASGAPRGEGRPMRKTWGAGGDEGGAPRGRGAAGRPERKEWSAGGAGRPERKAWGAGGDEGGAPRGRGAGRAERGGEERPRARGFGAGGAGRAERGGEERPRARDFGAGRAERGGEERPRARGFGAGGAGRPERGGEERPRARGFGAGGAGRPERREWSAGGGASGAPRGEGRPMRKTWGGGDEGRAPRGAGRPERRESGARGEGRPAFGGGAGARGAGGRPERRSWSPTDERGNPSERIVRAGARRGPPSEGEGGEKSGGFQDWSKKKERGVTPRWSSGPPRGGAGRPPPRGPRRPR